MKKGMENNMGWLRRERDLLWANANVVGYSLLADSIYALCKDCEFSLVV